MRWDRTPLGISYVGVGAKVGAFHARLREPPLLYGPVL